MIKQVKTGEDILVDVERLINSAGGISNFVSKSETVLLKVNFNTADPFPASSDIEFIKAVIVNILKAEPKKIIVGDSCTFSQNTYDVMCSKKAYSLEDIDPRVQVMNFDERKWLKMTIHGAKYLRRVSLPDVLEQIDKLILLPCLKTHSWAQYTGALKLSVGLMKPSERIPLHMGKLQEKIAELNLVINPDLVIMDARKCFINKGPSSGEIREPKKLLISDSRIEIDETGVEIIKEYEGNDLANTEELTQIKYAKELGIK